MFEKSSRGWFVLTLCALVGAGCGRSAGGPMLVADDADAVINKLRTTTASATAEPEEVESSAPAVAPTEWGDLTGRFLFEGKRPSPSKITVTKDEQVCGKHNLVVESLEVGPQNGLKNVVVFIATSKKQKLFVHPDYEATAGDVLRFDNKNCRFEPHVLPMRISQTLELHNSDSVSHNSDISPPGEPKENALLGAERTFDYHFKKQQNNPVPITCGIHPWMKGYVVVRDNPYAAVTDDDGRFKIEKLPPGKHEFVVWHERAKGGFTVSTKTVELKKGKFKSEIQPGSNDLGTLEIAATAFKPE